MDEPWLAPKGSRYQGYFSPRYNRGEASLAYQWAADAKSYNEYMGFAHYGQTKEQAAAQAEQMKRARADYERDAKEADRLGMRKVWDDKNSYYAHRNRQIFEREWAEDQKLWERHREVEEDRFRKDQKISDLGQKQRADERRIKKEQADEAARQGRILRETREAYQREIDKLQTQMKQQQEAANNLAAQNKAQANAAANPQRAAFGGKPPTLLGGSDKNTAGIGGGTLFFSDANKLGWKERLGGRTLLSGA